MQYVISKLTLYASHTTDGSRKTASFESALFLFFLVDDVVGAARNLQSLGVLLYEGVDVAHALLVKNLVHGNEDARLLHVAEAVVDGGAEELHRGREAHVGVDQRRDVVAQLAHLAVENAVVGLEVILAEQLAQLLLGSLDFERLEGDDEVLAVVKVFLEEIENHVAAPADVGGIHGHLAEEILDVGLDDGERAQPVPQVVEGEEALGPHARALVGQGDEGAAQLHGVGHVVLEELVREMEHVAGGELGLAVRVKLPVGAEQVAVAAYNLLGLGVPHDELLVAVGTGVELVDVDLLARAAPGLAESDFAQASYLAHHVGCVVCRDHINLVVALVGHSQLPLGCQLALEQLLAHWFDDWLFHLVLFL